MKESVRKTADTREKEREREKETKFTNHMCIFFVKQKKNWYSIIGHYGNINMSIKEKKKYVNCIHECHISKEDRSTGECFVAVSGRISNNFLDSI